METTRFVPLLSQPLHRRSLQAFFCSATCGPWRPVEECKKLRGPPERVRAAARRVREPGDLALRIDRQPGTERPAERAQILHATGRGPQERMVAAVRRGEGVPRDLALRVDRGRATES